MAKRLSRRGHAAVEVALMIPWMVFSFVATLDFGIFAYALISTENAARTAAMYASQSLAVAQSGSVTTSACYYALEELRDAPGVGPGVTTCGGTPVSVTVTARTPGTSGINTVTVSVTYQTMPVMAMPGLMPGSLSISKTVEMPIR
jgi:Flp pilus assembly protein TadG